MRVRSWSTAVPVLVLLLLCGGCSATEAHPVEVAASAFEQPDASAPETPDATATPDEEAWKRACFLTLEEAKSTVAATSADFRIDAVGPFDPYGSGGSENASEPWCSYSSDAEYTHSADTIEIRISKINDQSSKGIIVSSPSGDDLCASTRESFTSSIGTGRPFVCGEVSGHPIAYMSYRAAFVASDRYWVSLQIDNWESGEPYDLILAISSAIIDSPKFAALVE